MLTHPKANFWKAVFLPLGGVDPPKKKILRVVENSQAVLTYSHQGLASPGQFFVR